MVITGQISRVEVAAAIACARRMNLISPEEAFSALRQFQSEWESYQRLPIKENTVMRADALAYEHNLRGHYATHLAYALIWQETLGMPDTITSFDSQLLETASEIKMAFLPSR